MNIPRPSRMGPEPMPIRTSVDTPSTSIFGRFARAASAFKRRAMETFLQASRPIEISRDRQSRTNDYGTRNSGGYY